MTRRTGFIAPGGACIHRRDIPQAPGSSCTVSEDSPCPGALVPFCIAFDFLRAAWFVVWRPIRKMYFTAY